MEEKIGNLRIENKICCICGKFRISENNPWPVKDRGFCCDFCYHAHVIPARFKMLKEERRRDERNN